MSRCSRCEADLGSSYYGSDSDLCNVCYFKKHPFDALNSQETQMDNKLEDLTGQGRTIAKEMHDCAYGQGANPINYFKQGTRAANRALDLLESNLKPTKLVWGDLQSDAKKTLYRALQITVPILEAELEEELGGPGPREYVVDSIRAELNRTRVLAASLKTSIGGGP